MLDMFTPIVPEEKQHPNFKSLLISINKPTRDRICRWTEGFIDRDGKIVKEFQTTFNSTFWELYLHACFNELGFTHNYVHDSPDFLISKNDTTFSAEATIASHPSGARPEWDKEFPTELSPDTKFQIIHLSTIRLANAIYTKFKKYKDNYQNLEHVNKNPFILCVAPFDQPFFFEQADIAIRRILYKFNAPLYIKDEKSGEIRIVGEEYVEKVIKHNNEEIDLGFFTDERMKEISAVIFSNTATITKVKALDSEMYPETIFCATRYNSKSFDTPHYISGIGANFKETLLDGLHLYINPFAEKQFDPDLFFSEEISLHTYDPIDQSPLEFVNNGALLAHFCMSFHKQGTFESVKLSNQASQYKEYEFKWEEGVLYSLSATVGLGVNNHIAHYRGWTVVVFEDSQDGDWGGIAKRKIMHTLQDFLSLKDENDIMSHKFHQSNLEAFNSMKLKIDELFENHE
jgi:hypothetical protein